MDNIRVGIIGLGANARQRHVPGFRACPGVELTGVCNRRPESTQQAAAEFGIPKTYDHWQQLIADPEIDAVLIGTWPYLHCEITLAALESGKHVLTEARMAMTALEAHRMLDASRQHPDLVAQIVPSPFGLKGHDVMKQLIADGYLGELREIVVLGATDTLADTEAPLHWRQSAKYSGLNTLTLGILHETLIRWVDDPVLVQAQVEIFTTERFDPETQKNVEIGVPDCVHAMTRLPNRAMGLYHISGVARFGTGFHIHLYGTEGTLKYTLAPEDRLLGGRAGDAELQEIEIPPEKARSWRVEQEFVDAIRGEGSVEMTDFETGVRYMEFTEAVARSAHSGAPVAIPLVKP